MKAKYLQHIMSLSQDKEDDAEYKNDADDDDHNKKAKSKPSTRTKKNTRNKSTQTPHSDDNVAELDNFPSPPPSMEDSVDEDTTSSGGGCDEHTTTAADSNNSDQPPPPKKRSPMRYFGYALLLWFLEFGTVLVLKRLGIQLPEFNEEVVQNVFDKQFGRLNESMPAALSYLTQQTKRPGFQLAKEGAKDHYPVVLVHGFVTSGLEVWAGQECAKKHFRQRFWASMYGTRSFLSDRDCWREHMSLNPYTGADPPGIRLRAATGFEAVDYFMANYWVFAKIIENLADLGYSPSNMAVETYDWRLGFQAVEKRDGTLTSIKNRIELLHKIHGRKVVLTSHSMGVLLVHHFFAWVTTDEENGGGGGGYDWVDRHIHAYANVAGSHLGVPKAVTTLLSGDLSDFVTLNPVEKVVESFFGRIVRRQMWNTWGSIWMMLPKGPASIWDVGADMCRNRTSESNETTTDPFCPEDTEQPSPLLVMSDVHNETVQHAVDADDTENFTATEAEFIQKQTHTNRETIDFLKAYGGGYGNKLSNAVDYSYHDDDGQCEEPNPRTWHDPTRTPLPYAPNLKIYCLYGVGLETERAYYYRRNVVNEGNKSVLEEPVVVHDATVQQPEHNVHYGIRYGDGDGSVPLISLGYICADAWQRESSGLNPSGAKVYTREYKHRSGFTVDDFVRSGPNSGDHVDFLGNGK
uniref:Phospholipid:diacylglycerol acyltransferase n=1 Tax=Amphora coffeiformis TaxID=265554 RepID=A0A7S3LIG2_9STRA